MLSRGQKLKWAVGAIGVLALALVLPVILLPRSESKKTVSVLRGTKMPSTDVSPAFLTNTSSKSREPNSKSSVGGPGGLQPFSDDPVEREPQIQKLVESLSVSQKVKLLDELWQKETSDAHRELTGELLRGWAREMPQ